MLLVINSLLLGTASALRPPLLRPATPLRARPAMSKLTQPEDTLVFYGDAAFCSLYGAVQGAIDNALTPLATTRPELFTNTDALPEPIIQGVLLAAVWVAACQLLGGYQTEVTRSGGTPVLTSCLLTWVVSSAVLLGAAWLLQSQFGLGPGLREDELSFVTGSLTVMGGWRLIVVAALPY